MPFMRAKISGGPNKVQTTRSNSQGGAKVGPGLKATILGKNRSS
jgi:hypothetical protein